MLQSLHVLIRISSCFLWLREDLQRWGSLLAWVRVVCSVNRWCNTNELFISLGEELFVASIPYISPELLILFLVKSSESEANICILLYLFYFTECRRSGSLHSECSWVNTCFIWVLPLSLGILWMSLLGYCYEGLDRLFDWLDCSYHLPDNLWIGAWSCYLISVLDCVHIVEIHLSKRRELSVDKT